MIDSNLTNSKPIIMGIVNATPDSFYDGGIAFDDRYLKNIIDEFNSLGVDMIDVGAESSKPGASEITSDEEIARLSKVLPKIIDRSNAIISVDTTKYAVAKYALDQGVSYINDISGGASEDTLKLIAEYNAGIIIMHKQGSSKTMQINPNYDDVVSEIKQFLSKKIKLAQSFGIKSVIIDPGIGFGKTLEHNLLLLKHVDEFLDLNVPILIGTSNKSFIEHITGASINERIPGSIASVIATYQKGAHIFRVHNVKETIQALDVFKAINE